MNKRKLHLQEVVYLGGQLIDHTAGLLRPHVLLRLAGDELLVPGAARGELQQEVRSLLVAGQAAETILVE